MTLAQLKGQWRTLDGAVLMELRADGSGTLEGASVRFELSGDLLTARGKDGGDVRTLKVLEVSAGALKVELQGSAVALVRGKKSP